VMESGGGGTWWPYYAHKVAYVTAYELTLASQADMMEGDFIPETYQPLNKASSDAMTVSRYRELLAYGLGFTDAKADHAQRPAPQFVSVTSRRIFRPWGTGWVPWDWVLGVPFSPDECLSQDGFVFSGIGEEGLVNLPAGTPLVLYSPTIPSEKGWNEFVQGLKSGRIRTAIVVAGGLQNVVTRQFVSKPFASIFPDFTYVPAPPQLNVGRLLDENHVAAGNTTYELHGAVCRPAADDTVVLSLEQKPLVVRRMVGPSSLYVVLFDPSLKNNSGIADEVYARLLDKQGIIPQWRTPVGMRGRVYQASQMLIAGVHSDKLRDSTEFRHAVTNRTYLPYTADTGVQIEVKAKPNADFEWLALPSGARGKCHSGQDVIEAPKTGPE
jgi:hypothetical protein